MPTNALFVPEEVATISAALKLACSGDTILVGPGVYYESLQITKNIEIRGVADTASIILVAQSNDAPLIECIGANLSISNITLTSMESNNSSDREDGDEMTNENKDDIDDIDDEDELDDNNHINKPDDLLLSRMGGSIYLAYCDIQCGRSGVIISEGSARLLRCAIHHCKEAALVLVNGAKVNLEECEVHDSGVGIDLNGKGSTLIMRGDNIFGCKRGIDVSLGAILQMEETYLHDNSEHGITLDGADTRGVLVRSYIQRNKGVGIRVQGTASATIMENEITKNGMPLSYEKTGLIASRFNFDENGAMADFEIGFADDDMASPVKMNITDKNGITSTCSPHSPVASLPTI